MSKQTAHGVHLFRLVLYNDSRPFSAVPATEATCKISAYIFADNSTNQLSVPINHQNQHICQPLFKIVMIKKLLPDFINSMNVSVYHILISNKFVASAKISTKLVLILFFSTACGVCGEVLCGVVDPRRTVRRESPYKARTLPHPGVPAQLRAGKTQNPAQPKRPEHRAVHVSHHSRHASEDGVVIRLSDLTQACMTSPDLETST